MIYKNYVKSNSNDYLYGPSFDKLMPFTVFRMVLIVSLFSL